MTPKAKGIAILTVVALSGIGAMQALINDLDRDPIGEWCGERMYAQQIAFLKQGDALERERAAAFLAAVGLGREDVRLGLREALKDPDPVVAANSALGLKFAFHEDLQVTRAMFMTANRAPATSLNFSARCPLF